MNTQNRTPKYLHRPRRSALRLAVGLTAAAPLLALPQMIAPAPVWAQQEGVEELEPAPTSRLAKIALPKSALRMRQVPGEMQESLSKLVAAARLRQGESEVLAWQQGYTRANAPRLLAGVQSALQKAGWKTQSSDTGEGFRILSAGKPGQPALLGVWAPTDEVAVLAWTEVFKPAADEPADAQPNPEPPAQPQAQREIQPESQAQAAPQAQPAAGAITLDVDARTQNVNVMKRVMPGIPNFPTLTPKPGFVRGYAKDSAGKPLANARIGVRSTAVGGAYSGAQGKTDAKGYYEIAVPFGAAHFYNAGYSVDYGEGRAALGLHPADGELDSFASNVGGVENFVLLSYGIADADEAQDNPRFAGNYYGGAVSFSWDVADGEGSSGLPANSQIEITLTPQGALLDGSAGKSIVIRKGAGTFFGQLYVTNIPAGTYRLSVRLAGGGALKMKESGPYRNEPFGLAPKEANGAATLQFRPGTAKADMVTAGRGGWDSVSLSLSR